MQGIKIAISRMALGAFSIALLLGMHASRAQESAAPDFRYMEAVPSPRAARSLLLDATRADGRILAVGERGFIIYSDDDGTTWSQANVPVSVTLTAVNFPSPGAGWAVGHEGTILHSSDGGVNWTVQLNAEQVTAQEVAFGAKVIEQIQERMNSADEVELEDLQYELDDAQYALEDAQEAVSTGGTTNPFLDVWFADEMNGLAVGAYGMAFRTADGGQNWEIASYGMENPDKYHYYSLSSPDGATVYMSGEAGMLFRSDDKGKSWMRLESPYEGSFFGIVAESNGGDGKVITFGLRGNIFVSNDKGDSWQKRSPDNENTLMGGNILADGRLIIVGRSGTLLISDDGGDTFSVQFREDRSSYSAVVAGGDGSLILVGEGGIHHAGPDGSAR
jgi:photosystem II stability/assembly factor-like uncharacterized protein